MASGSTGHEIDVNVVSSRSAALRPLANAEGGSCSSHDNAYGRTVMKGSRCMPIIPDAVPGRAIAGACNHR